MEDKINHIGKMLADIQLELYLTRKCQEKILDFLLDENKLDAERLWRKMNKKEGVEQ